MTRRIELLVHAGAPSGRRDDEKYKAQAAAYLSFQGDRTKKLGGIGPDPPPSTQQASGHQGESHDATPGDQSPAGFLGDTQLAITGLDSQLFTSSLPLAQNEVQNPYITSKSSMTKAAACSDPDTPAHGEHPVFRESALARDRSNGKRKHTEDGNEDAARDALAQGALTGNSRIGGGNTGPSRASSEASSLSSYLKTPALARSVKKRRVDEKPADTALVVSPYRAFPDGSHKGLAFVGTSNAPSAPPATAPAAVVRSQNSLGISEPATSELPTSYSLSDITSESSRARVGNSQRFVKAPQGLDEGESSSSGKVDASTVSPSTGDRSVGRDEGIAALESRPPANLEVEKQTIVVADDTQDKTGDAAISSNAVASERKAATVTNANGPPLPAHKECPTSNISPKAAPPARPDILQKLHGLSTTIIPPEAVTSADKFKTHLTPGLCALSSNSATSDRYQPVSISRDLRPQERGYWLLDSSTWSLETQVVFWEFMERAIGSGSLGWGIWCTRDNESQERNPKEGAGKVHGLGPLRVYCWGEIVREVWLLLYVASRSQARKVGMSWFDAEGKVVVQMKKV